MVRERAGLARPRGVAAVGHSRSSARPHAGRAPQQACTRRTSAAFAGGRILTSNRRPSSSIESVFKSCRCGDGAPDGAAAPTLWGRVLWLRRLLLLLAGAPLVRQHGRLHQLTRMMLQTPDAAEPSMESDSQSQHLRSHCSLHERLSPGRASLHCLSHNGIKASQAAPWAPRLFEQKKPASLCSRRSQGEFTTHLHQIGNVGQ